MISPSRRKRRRHHEITIGSITDIKHDNSDFTAADAAGASRPRTGSASGGAGGQPADSNPQDQPFHAPRIGRETIGGFLSGPVWNAHSIETGFNRLSPPGLWPAIPGNQPGSAG